jgi:predicted DNA-binding ArsR family transcriptional regulator
MPTQQEQNAAVLARLATAINALDTKSALALANAIAALPPSVLIDDAATANNKVWSSNKTQTQITAAIAAIINGAGVSSDTLKELADQITALMQADNGLVSAIAVQQFNDAQKTQACTNLGIGNPFHNYVTAIEAALNPGL